MKEWKNGRMEEEIIEPLLPELPSGKRGRPWRDNREVLEVRWTGQKIVGGDELGVIIETS